MKKLVLAFLVGFAANLPAQPQPDNAAAEAAIAQLREGLIEKFFKGDIDGTLAYLASDVVVTWQNGEVSRGPAEVRAYYQRMMTGPDRVVRDVKAKPEILGRHIYGDWAVSWGKLNDHFTLTDGRDLALDSRFTITTAKRGDRWLVTGYHASVNAFDNAILGLAVKKTAWWAGGIAAVAGLLLGWLVARARRTA